MQNPISFPLFADIFEPPVGHPYVYLIEIVMLYFGFFPIDFQSIANVSLDSYHVFYSDQLH